MVDKQLFSSESTEWETPRKFYKQLTQILGQFEYDAASTEENKKCDKRLKDGLIDSWNNKKIWCNPPYAIPENPCKANCKKKKCKDRGYHVDTYQPGTADWINTAVKSNAMSCLLLPARTDTNGGQAALVNASYTIFLKGRLTFEINGQPVVNPKTGKSSAAPFPSMLCLFNWRLHNETIEEFKELGAIFNGKCI